MAHLADAKSMLDSRGLYEGATVHGVNPLLLVEKIIRYFDPLPIPDPNGHANSNLRERIFESLYWKEQTFGLNGGSSSEPHTTQLHPTNSTDPD